MNTPFDQIIWKTFTLSQILNKTNDVGWRPFRSDLCLKTRKHHLFPKNLHQWRMINGNPNSKKVMAPRYPPHVTQMNENGSKELDLANMEFDLFSPLKKRAGSEMWNTPLTASGAKSNLQNGSSVMKIKTDAFTPGRGRKKGRDKKGDPSIVRNGSREAVLRDLRCFKGGAVSKSRRRERFTSIKTNSESKVDRRAESYQSFLKKVQELKRNDNEKRKLLDKKSAFRAIVEGSQEHEGDLLYKQNHLQSIFDRANTMVQERDDENRFRLLQDKHTNDQSPANFNSQLYGTIHSPSSFKPFLKDERANMVPTKSPLTININWNRKENQSAEVGDNANAHFLGNDSESGYQFEKQGQEHLTLIGESLNQSFAYSFPREIADDCLSSVDNTVNFEFSQQEQQHQQQQQLLFSPSTVQNVGSFKKNLFDNEPIADSKQPFPFHREPLESSSQNTGFPFGLRPVPRSQVEGPEQPRLSFPLVGLRPVPPSNHKESAKEFVFKVLKPEPDNSSEYELNTNNRINNS